MPALVKQSGRYYLQFFDASRSPKRKRVSLKTTRKRPAQTKRRELEDAYLRGAFCPWSDGLRGDPFGYERIRAGACPPLALLQSKGGSGLSPYTVKGYRYKVGAFARSAGQKRRLRYLTAGDVRRYAFDPGVSRTTHRRRVRVLSAFFEHCRRAGYFAEVEVPTDPVEAPKTTEQLPVAVKEFDLEQIEEAVGNTAASTRHERRDSMAASPLSVCSLHGPAR